MKKDSFNANEIPADKGLSGNEKIEEAIAALQEEPGNSLERGAESGKEIGCPACKGN